MFDLGVDRTTVPVLFARGSFGLRTRTAPVGLIAVRSRKISSIKMSCKCVCKYKKYAKGSGPTFLWFLVAPQRDVFVEF